MNGLIGKGRETIDPFVTMGDEVFLSELNFYRGRLFFFKGS